MGVQATPTLDDGSRSSGARALGIGAATLVTLIAAFTTVAHGWITGTGLGRYDAPVLDAMVALRTPIGATVVTGFTRLGDGPPLMIIALVLTTLLYRRYRRWSTWAVMILAPLGSLGLSEAAKLLFARPRPPYADAVPPYEVSPAFPSGHTLNSTAVAGLLGYLTFWLARRAWVAVAGVIAAVTWSLLMGLSRLYLGHHWLTDVTGGWLLGLCWVIVVISIHQAALRHDTARDASSDHDRAAAGGRFPFAPKPR